MNSYAIIEANGKQFWVEENRFYDFDKLPLSPGDSFSLNKVLFVNKNNSILIGQPYLKENCTVEAEVLRDVSGPKIRVYKMRPKKKTRKTYGARKKFTRVLIKSIALRTEPAKITCYI